MKYIVTQNEQGNEEIFVFPNTINHDCMADALARIKTQMFSNWERQFRIPIRAGFVSQNLQCYGRSESLDLDSNPELDNKLLLDYF